MDATEDGTAGVGYRYCIGASIQPAGAKLLAKRLDVSNSRVRIVAGVTSRTEVVRSKTATAALNLRKVGRRE